VGQNCWCHWSPVRGHSALGRDNLKQAQLDQARRQLRQLERQLREAEAIDSSSYPRAQALLDEAKQVGLVDERTVATTYEAVLAILQRIIRNDQIQSEVVMADGEDMLASLRSERQGLRNELERVNSEIRSTRTFTLETKPDFNTLQNFGSAGAALHYFIFDVLVMKGQDVMAQPLVKRLELLEEHVYPQMEEPIRYSPVLEGSLEDLIQSVKVQGLEGLVAKRRNSCYEPGMRSGQWQKMRVNQGQEFVIGGYTVGGATFDAIVFGYYDGDDLVYAARTRNGFTPKLRAELLKKFRPLEIKECPFVNLPEKKAGRWGAGLTAAKMQECRWLRPVLVGQFKFVEWTQDAHLRHSRFVGLREDKNADTVRREADPAGQ